jgi:CRISPR-associated protein Cmr3
MSEQASGSGGADEVSTVFLLEPNDVWFFRDGRPFDAQDAAQISMPSLFPPMPRTAIGAVRVALALALGWEGGGRDWSGDAKIRSVVGSDDELGALEGARIFLVRLAGDEIDPLFPIPHALIGEPGEKKDAPPRRLVRLRPQGAGGPLHSDLGQMSLTVPAAANAEACESIANKYWFDVAAMAEFLDGGTPDEHDVVTEKEVFRRETRTGIALKRDEKIVEEGMLYRVGFARPAARTGLRIAIAVALRPGETRADGIDLSGVPVPFGGEGRIAWIGSRRAALDWPAPPRMLANSPHAGELRYSVTLATPADLGQVWPKPGEPLPGLPGRIESACMDRAVAVSGWRGFGNIGPRMSRALIPAGATWFMTARPDERDPRECHGAAIGEQTAWGYGRIMIGTWGKE